MGNFPQQSLRRVRPWLYQRLSRKVAGCGGYTIVELMVTAALISVGLSPTAAVADATRQDARVAQCANKLRLLAVAAHNYADEFDKNFFYQGLPARRLDGDGATRRVQRIDWFDPDQVGRYLVGDEVGGPPGYPGPYLDKFPLGIGGTNFTCPSDLPGAARSYGMNAWSSGVGEGNEHLVSEHFMKHGQIFDRSAPGLDRILLFTDSLSLIETRRGWVSGGMLGARHHPGQRFGGKGGFGFITQGLVERFRRQVTRTDMDYARHGPSGAVPGDNIGSVNIAYADGSVGFRSSAQLFDRDTGRSTLNTLWSPIDAELENR